MVRICDAIHGHECGVLFGKEGFVAFSSIIIFIQSQGPDVMTSSKRQSLVYRKQNFGKCRIQSGRCLLTKPSSIPVKHHFSLNVLACQLKNQVNFKVLLSQGISSHGYIDESLPLK